MDLYKRVGELVEELKDKITDQEFFSSPVYNQFIAKKTRNILTGTFYTLEKKGFALSEYDENRLLKSIQTAVEYNTSPGAFSHTVCDYAGNQRITLNACDSFMMLQPDRWNKHLALQGLLYHEIGHVLFTDFPTLRAWDNQISKGVWFPAAPKRSTNENGINLNTMMQSGPEYRKLIEKIANDIQNIGEDGYVEREIKEMFPGNGKQCLAVYNCKEEETMISFPEALNCESMSVFQAITQQAFYYARYGYMKLDGYSGQYSDTLYECADILDGFNNRDPMVRCSATNELLCVLQPYLSEEIERLQKEEEQQQQQNQQGSQQQNGQSPQNGNNQQGGSSAQNGQSGNQKGNNQSGEQNGQNGNQSGNQQNGQNWQNGNQQNGSIPQLSKSVADKISEALNNMTKGMNTKDHAKTGQTSRSVNNPNNACNKGASHVQNPNPNSQQSAGSADTGAASTDAGKAEMDNLLDKLAEAKANAQAEKERTDELNKDNNVVDGSEYGVKGNSVKIVRASEVSLENEEFYDKAMETLAPISRDLQRGIKRVIKERREGGKRKNLPFGRRLEVSSIVHGDCRYFSRNKLPTEFPKLGVGLLVDESGSTSGDLIDSARCASILIEDFCRELDIPHIISGYTTAYNSHKDALILSYAEPGTVDKKDAYRITGMSARSGTPTKAALLYMLQRMKKLPVDIRMLIIISDGESGDDQRGDIKKIVEGAAKGGEFIIAAGIGNDRKKVEAEFGKEHFLDISDLNTMPEQIIRLIKDNIFV